MTITKAASFANLFFRCTSIFSVLLVLGACSYFDVEQPEGGATIDLTHGGGVSQSEPAQNNAIDLLELSNRISSGSVQVFSLDQPAGAASEYRAAPARSSYPHVEIYPLDEAMRELVAPVNATQSWTPVPAVPVEPVSRAERFGAYDPLAVTGSNEAAAQMVYFAHDQITPASGALDGVAEGVSGAARVKISGHASKQSSISDPIARQIVNLRVSMERAFSVAKSLIERGVPAENIEVVAYGEAFPAQGNANIDAQSASRRVEILTQ